MQAQVETSNELQHTCAENPQLSHIVLRAAVHRRQCHDPAYHAIPSNEGHLCEHDVQAWPGAQDCTAHLARWAGTAHRSEDALPAPPRRFGHLQAQ